MATLLRPRITPLLIVLVFATAAPVLAASYFVSPLGDDAAAGTAEQPWRTINYGLSRLTDGDELVLADGVYAEVVALPSRPAATNYITIRAANPRQAVVDGGGTSDYCLLGPANSNCDWIRLVGLKVTGARYKGLYAPHINHLWIEGCEFTNCGVEATQNSCAAMSFVYGNDLTIRSCHVHDNYRGIGVGVKGVGGVDRVTIEDSSFLDNHSRAAVVSTYGANTDGIVCEGLCTDVIISRCVARGSQDCGFDIKPPGAVMNRCLAYGNTYGGFKIWGLGAKLINCLAYDNGDTGLSFSGDAIEVWNCTIALNGRAGLRPGATDNTTVRVRNCIIAYNMNRQYDTNIYDDDYNMYYAAPGETAWRFFLDTMVSYTLADLQGGAIRLGAHTVFADPQFVSAATRDLHLAPASPAVGAGVWADFLTEDLDGKLRRLGAPPDLGALTTTIQLPNRPPTAPTATVIAPKTPSTTADLVARASGSTDPDDNALTYRYQWAKSTDSGATWSGWDWNGTTLSQDLTTRGELWKARGRAHDGVLVGPWLESAPVTIRNAAPTAPASVTITPPQPGDGQKLVALAAGATDPDDDALSYRYKWYRSLDAGETWLAALTVRVLPADQTTVGEWWRAAARAYDGANWSSWAFSAPVTIGAPAPTALALTAAMADTREDGIALTVSLTAPATVQASIRNLAGREVGLLPAQALSSGLSTLHWNGRSASGTRVPSGHYLLRLTARTPEGRCATCLVPVLR